MKTVIIGAGASGLACAVELKRLMPSAKVTVLERLENPGKKILATGNGRCNLSNTKAEHSDEVLSFFNDIGLKTRTDSEGRIYPYSLKAKTVLNVLLAKCEELNVTIITACTVSNIREGFEIETNKGVFRADNVVVASGGKAQSVLGSNGSGYAMLQKFGHSCTELYPALVQLLSSSKYPKRLSGQRVRCRAAITLDGEEAASTFGEILFTDYGLSGIAAMELSAAVSKNFASKEPKKCCAVLDLVPDMSQQELIGHIEKFGSLGGILGFDVAEIIDKQAGSDPERSAKICKNWTLIVTGTKGFNFAQITGGGIPCSEFENYRSKFAPGLYAVGEVLDVQLPCGGYNLNFAFYSGIEAAKAITENKK